MLRMMRAAGTSESAGGREWGNVDGLLIWLSGASPRILRQCPTERPKYTGIGSVILVTSLLAAISMGFLLQEDVGATLGWATVLSIVWGVAIAALDRWLTVSLDRQPAPLRYLFLALPRILLGVLIGVVITVPLMMQIFRSDIDARITVDQNVQVNSFLASLPNSVIGREVSADQAKIASLQKTISTDGFVAPDITADPVVVALTAQRQWTQTQANAAYKLWQEQLTGTGQGNVAGNGPLAEADHSEYVTLASQVSSLNSQIQAREKIVDEQAAAQSAIGLVQAKQNLPVAKAQLDAVQAEFQALTTNGERAINSDTGLLAHLQAFSQETDISKVLTFAAVTVFLMFLLIQLLPIVVKVLLNLGPQSTYEKMVAYEEEASLRAAREDIARRQARRNLE
jgi:hypothetical protein